jgi:linoleoyl-CoA desaturase
MQQLGMVQRTIVRLAFPGGKPRPKPGPYKGGEGDDVAPTPAVRSERPTGANGSGPQQPDEGVQFSMPDR